MPRRLLEMMALLCIPARALQLCSRRRLGAGAAAAVAGVASVARAEVPVDPFNSMCFGFGCAQPQGVDGGGAPAPLDEDSTPWQEVLKLIDEKKVQRVEFNDVSMSKAWAVTADGRIRIGAGYPVDDGKSWSSPLFVTRTLENYRIPYSYVEGLKRKSPRS